MKIVISGDGETGAHLARYLSMESQDVTLIGCNRERLNELDSNYNLMTLRGDGTDPADQRRAGVADCDLFIAVTPEGNENVVSAQIARALGARRTVARVDNEGLMLPEMTEMLRRNGVDTLVYPEQLAAREISEALGHSWARTWFELRHGALAVAAVKVMPGAEIDGLRLKSLDRSRHPFHVAAIKRDGCIQIPGGESSIMANDILYLSLLPANCGSVPSAAGRRGLSMSRVMISGAGKLTRQTLGILVARGMKITVVDSNRERCAALSRLFPSVTVVNADQRDREVLAEEGLRQVDAFLALNDSSEMNIIGCMLAKGAGVPWTVAEIEDIQYFDEAESLDIDVVVNKKLMASSAIFQMLLDSRDLQTSKCLALEDAEVVEIEVEAGARITKSAVRDLRLPSGMTIAGMVRGSEGRLVTGDTHIQAGDRLVVFCLSGSFAKFSKVFR